MTIPQKDSHPSSRRQVIENIGLIAAAGVVAGTTIPLVYPGGTDTIRVALVGCGGRGTGAAANCLSVDNGPIKLVAMADLFENRLTNSYANLASEFGEQVEVPGDRRFIGFDGYKHSMDALSAGDVVILATPPAFRWPHFSYAIDKGIHVFMEKPVSVDGPTTRRMLVLGEKAKAKNLKIGVGLMCRHCVARNELFKRIQDGAIGEIIFERAYRMHAPIASSQCGPRPPEEKNELLWQIANFHSFFWASGGAFSDFYIHNIDEACWMKGDWPVMAQAVGSRHYQRNAVDQNFDNYSVEYTYEDGTKFFFVGRLMSECHDEFTTTLHGTKGMAVVSSAGHSPSNCRIYNRQKSTRKNLIWRAPEQQPDPYQLEWDHLIQAVRDGLPFNEVGRSAEASMVAVLGRLAAHTGQEVVYEDALKSVHELASHVDVLTIHSPAPITANEFGRYALPMPGINKQRDFHE